VIEGTNVSLICLQAIPVSLVVYKSVINIYP